MSDRIAVFDTGRIQQVDRPEVVYEYPASAFVAGFVGTSNLLHGPAARAVLGSDGVYSVRPEKIRIVGGGDAQPAGTRTAAGTVREVEYVGAFTRFIVDLDAGGRLVAIQQNQDTSSSDVTTYRSRRVLLAWAKEHEFAVRPHEPSHDATT